MNDRQICTRLNPMPPDEKFGSWDHQDAKEVNDEFTTLPPLDDDHYIRYECPNCRKRFWVDAN